MKTIEVRQNTFKREQKEKEKKEEEVEIEQEQAQSNMKMCDSCYEEQDLDQFFSLSCKHEFCKDCLLYHLETKINDGQIAQIPCMQAGCH